MANPKPAKRMKAWPILLVAIITVLGGSGFVVWRTYFRPKPSVHRPPLIVPSIEDPSAPETDEEANLRVADWWRQGNVRATGAIDTIQEAFAEAKRVTKQAKPDTKEALEAAFDLIDDAGSNMAECTTNPPSTEQVASDFRKWDEARIRNIGRAETAAMNLREAFGIVSSLAPAHPELIPLKRLTGLAREDAILVVTGFGGQWPPPNLE
ncbi:MAG: hypothetical protein KF812_01670 [Fimbriimonadaceae bacterium]|nr:hypothetical protein [Fimbriimonadaceae bacterium]